MGALGAVRTAPAGGGNAAAAPGVPWTTSGSSRVLESDLSTTSEAASRSSAAVAGRGTGVNSGTVAWSSGGCGQGRVPGWAAPWRQRRDGVCRRDVRAARAAWASQTVPGGSGEPRLGGGRTQTVVRIAPRGAPRNGVRLPRRVPDPVRRAWQAHRRHGGRGGVRLLRCGGPRWTGRAVDRSGGRGASGSVECQRPSVGRYFGARQAFRRRSTAAPSERSSASWRSPAIRSRPTGSWFTWPAGTERDG